MENKKILIIGNPNSAWIKSFIGNVFDNTGFRVYLLCYEPIRENYIEYYERRLVSFLGNPRKNSNKISRFYNLLYAKLKLKLDIIHIHYLSDGAYRFAWCAKAKNSKIIGTYWGSDIFRISEKNAKVIKKRFKKTDAITMMSEKIANRFFELYGDEFADKCIWNMPFGNEVFSHITEIEKRFSRKDCKNEFNADPERILISVGYNGTEAQQHDIVLEQLAHLSDVIKDRINLILHMGYGLNSEAYLQKVRDLSNALGIKTILLFTFLDFDEIAKLRLASDIYINAQTTDDYSGSVMEYLYAGCMLISGEWLNYRQLDKSGISYIKFNDFSELPKLVSEAVESEKVRFIENRAAITSIFSWDCIKHKWHYLYDSILNL